MSVLDKIGNDDLFLRRTADILGLHVNNDTIKRILDNMSSDEYDKLIGQIYGDDEDEDESDLVPPDEQSYEDHIDDDDVAIAREVMDLPASLSDEEVKNTIRNMGYDNFLDLISAADDIDASKSVNVNGDKDDDIVAIDRDSDGDVDTAFITTQSPKETKDAVNKAKDMLSNGNESKDNSDEITDSNIPTDDDSKHNVIAALKDLRF